MSGCRALLEGLEVSALDELLERGHYITAYRRTEKLWGEAGLFDALGPDEIVVAARLSSNLGNRMGARALIRRGVARYPDHEGLACCAISYAPRRTHPLDQLRDLADADTRPRFRDPVHQATWLAIAALAWSAVRDMVRARRMLEQAEALGGDRAYTAMARARVLLLDDRWAEALESAEYAWSLTPGRPAVAGTLANVLAQLGRVEEAASRLAEVADRGESFEVTTEAIRFALAMAEQSPERAASPWYARARSLMATLPAAAPLADRNTARLMEQIRFDVAHFGGDNETLEAIAREGRLPYLRTLASEIHSRGGAGLVTLPITPMRQRHNTCLPTAIGSLLGGPGSPVDVDTMVKEATYGGTSTWRAVDWLKQHGLEAHPVILNRAIVTALIEAGHPFVFVTSNLENAHAMTAFGLDRGADCLLIHDPSGLRWVRYSLEHFAEPEAPLGPEGILVGTAEEVARALSVVPRENAEPARLFMEYLKHQETSGTETADAVRAQLEREFPNHPVSYFVRALQLRDRCREREALKLLHMLLERFPRCERLQSAYMSVLETTGDIARQRSALEEVVEGAKLPGVGLSQEWRRPPAPFVAHYAMLISRSEDKAPKAIRLLRKSIAMNPLNARAYHALGALMFQMGERAGALLPAQVAASIEAENESAARFVMHVLSCLGREEEGFDYLRARAERLSAADRGAEAWGALISGFQVYGHPDRAVGLMNERIEAHGDNETLLAFAVRFYAEVGEWERAAWALGRLENAKNRLEYLEAATEYHRHRGEREKAEACCAAWRREAPASIEARRAQLELLTLARGQSAGVVLVEEWLRAQPENSHLEAMLYDLYSMLSDRPAIEALVARSLARDPDDAWAWRERAIQLLNDKSARLPAERPALEASLNEAIAACDRTCAENTTTYVIHARNAALDRQFDAAAEWYLRAIRRDPAMIRYTGELAEVLPGLPVEARRAALASVEKVLLESAGRLAGAPELSGQIAVHFGFQEAWEAVTRWRENRGRDPRLVEAAVDLLLEWGNGQTDARRALEMLREAVQWFPAEIELHHMLSRCLTILDATEEDEAFCRLLIARQPGQSRARIRLASILEHRGKVDEALELLETCLHLEPASPIARGFHAGFLWRQGRPLESIAALESAIALIPESIPLREQLVDCLANMGESARALGVIDSGLARFPRSAYLWYLRASLLRRSPGGNDYRPIEREYRKALSLNASLFEACDELASLLCDAGRHQEAIDLLEAHRPVVTNAVPLRGRLAWIRHARGDKSHALSELRALLDAEPRYVWGWRLLIEWILEGELKDLGKRLLPRVHELLPAEEDVRGRALLALTELDGQDDAYADDWNRLLADFPRGIDIHLIRFDLLMNWGRMDDARAILKSAERYYATSPWLRARDVRLALAEGDSARALASARAVWTHPSDDTEWPESVTWQALESAGLGKTALEIVQSAIGANYRVGTTVLGLACNFIGRSHWDFWGRGKVWNQKQNPSLSTLLPGRNARALLEMLELLDAISWEADEHRAVVLYALNQFAYGRLVYRWYLRNRARVENSPVLWQAVGAAVVDFRPQLSFWRTFFASWRDKPGIQLRNAAFYVLAFQHSAGVAPRSRREVEHLHEHASQALERLRHDHTTRYLACVAGTSLLQLGRWDAFLDCMERYGACIVDPSGEEVFLKVAKMVGVPEVLDGFHQLLRLDKPDAHDVGALADRVAKHITRQGALPWAVDAWHKCVSERYPGVAFDRRRAWKLKGFFGR